jgi:hypothetical protein
MERDLKNERLGLMFLKFLLYSVIAYFVIRFVRSFISGAKSTKTASGQTVGQKPRKTVAATMIRCDSCGTFITENSAMHTGSRFFCSNSCAKIGIQRT